MSLHSQSTAEAASSGWPSRPIGCFFMTSAGLENYCDDMVGTYNFPASDAPGWTLGG